jgi:hypothetical protein
LKPPRQLHDGTSEFFWPKQGCQQVDEQQKHNDADQHGLHGNLLQPAAEACIEAADDEEADNHNDEDQITHETPPPSRLDKLHRYSAFLIQFAFIWTTRYDGPRLSANQKEAR